MIMKLIMSFLLVTLCAGYKPPVPDIQQVRVKVITAGEDTGFKNRIGSAFTSSLNAITGISAEATDDSADFIIKVNEIKTCNENPEIVMVTILLKKTAAAAGGNVREILSSVFNKIPASAIEDKCKELVAMFHLNHFQTN